MPRTLKLMEEADLPQVSAVVTEALAPRSAECSINFQHGDERLILMVVTDIPASEVGAVYRRCVSPLLASLEGEFGEFGFEMRSLCACGAAATPMISSGDNPEHDMCLCGECINREIDGHRVRPEYTCPVCEMGFDGSGWSMRCSVKLVSDEGGEPEMEINSDWADISRRDCCSRKCALEWFRKWLAEVESHPVAREVTL